MTSMQWLEEIKLDLRLCGEGGLLLLLLAEQPYHLRTLVLGLQETEPTLAVVDRVDDFLDLADGTLVIYLPREDEFPGLNVGRPILAARRFRVLVWANRKKAEGLAGRAPDVFDWITRTVEVPGQAVPPFVIESLTKAKSRAASRFIWFGGNVEDGIRSVWSDASFDYLDAQKHHFGFSDALSLSQWIEKAEKPDNHSWLCLKNIHGMEWHQRADKAGLLKLERTIVLNPIGPVPDKLYSEYWSISDGIENTEIAISSLRRREVKQPSWIWALSRGEFDLIFCIMFVIAEHNESKIIELFRLRDMNTLAEYISAQSPGKRSFGKLGLTSSFLSRFRS